jgi:hypothetical protein
MKKRNAIPPVLLIVQFYFLKLADTLIHPLKGIPGLDFNNEYDSTML